MTLTLDLSPEMEADLAALAARQGLSLPEYLRHLLEEQVPLRAGTALSPSERAAAWRASVKDLPHTPPLSDEAISRESLYDARG
jgi:hypothetical protein